MSNQQQRNQLIPENKQMNKGAGIFFLMYTNYHFENLKLNLDHLDHNDKFKNIWISYQQYKSAYKCLLYLRYFGYAISLASQNYQVLHDVTMGADLAQYFQDYNTGLTKGIFVIVIVIQTFITGYLQNQIEASKKNQEIDLVADYFIDVLKILRSYLLFVIMVMVLKSQPNFDNWTSVIGFSLVCIAITVQKILKKLFFQEVVQRNQDLITHQIYKLQSEDIRQYLKNYRKKIQQSDKKEKEKIQQSTKKQQSDKKIEQDFPRTQMRRQK